MWAGIDGGWGCSGCTCMCVCVCVRVWRGDSITVMGKLDFFFSCGEEKEDGGQLQGSVMAPHHILCMYRWKKMKMFSQ